MNNKRNFETTSFSLHIMAMVFMLCDHLWGTSVVDHEFFTWIGRLTFPIYVVLCQDLVQVKMRFSSS